VFKAGALSEGVKVAAAEAIVHEARRNESRPTLDRSRAFLLLALPANGTFELLHLVGGVSPLARMKSQCYKLAVEH
jgi:hypothetical protein